MPQALARRPFVRVGANQSLRGSVSSLHQSHRMMFWIKNALIDLAITAVIAIFYFNGATWGWWIIVIYTPLMVLLKVFALSGIANAVQRKADDVPVWFYHLLFGANVVLLMLSNLLLLAAGWAAIWVLSTIAESRRPRSSSKA